MFIVLVCVVLWIVIYMATDTAISVFKELSR